MIQLTDEYREAAKKYKKTFGYGVPLSMIPPIVETKDLIKSIEECIESGEDRLLEIYKVDVNEGDLI